jgi:hypothetical protein
VKALTRSISRNTAHPGIHKKSASRRYSFAPTLIVRAKRAAKHFALSSITQKRIAANVYLLLYPKKPLAQAIKAKPELGGLLWQMLKSITPEVLRGEGRVYGGELYKMEPKELGNVSAHSIVSVLPSLSVSAGSQASLW